MSSVKSLDYTNPVKFAKQDVERTALGQLLVSDQYHQIVIPVFQRPYCWPQQQLEAWLENIIQGSHDPEADDVSCDVDVAGEFHSVGIGRFKRTEHGLICVDGQQRITTTSLFISALADTLNNTLDKIRDEECRDLAREAINKCEYFLFKDKDQLKLDLASNEDISLILTHLRVLSSHQDRLQFLRCVLGNRIDHQLPEINEDDPITLTKKYFLNNLEMLLSGSDADACVRQCVRMLHSSVVWMRMMVVSVQDEVDLCQWFLWLQEKSLLGFAALLMNDTPGVDFKAGDLVKNLLLSVFLEKSVSYQDQVYQRLWTPSLQKLSRDDAFLTAFLLHKENDIFVSEEKKNRYNMYGAEGDEKLSGLQLYGRFQTMYEKIVEEKKSSNDYNLEAIHVDLLSQFDSFSKDFISQ